MQMFCQTNEPPDLPPQPSPFIVEQYKAKLADLGNLGSRQASMTTYYVSILTALVGIFAFKDRSLADIDSTVLLMICGAGFLVACLWYSSLGFFRNLFRAKLCVLGEIERVMPFQTFEREFEAMKQHGNASWLWIERLVPMVFALFFLGLLVAKLLKSKGLML